DMTVASTPALSIDAMAQRVVDALADRPDVLEVL
ncbi:MAG: shikimate kinase, partial [Sulfitobacter sp.]|nr:shikimate kinase [Sulfitobacter sp.]